MQNRIGFDAIRLSAVDVDTCAIILYSVIRREPGMWLVSQLNRSPGTAPERTIPNPRFAGHPRDTSVDSVGFHDHLVRARIAVAHATVAEAEECDIVRIQADQLNEAGIEATLGEAEDEVPGMDGDGRMLYPAGEVNAAYNQHSGKEEGEVQVGDRQSFELRRLIDGDTLQDDGAINGRTLGIDTLPDQHSVGAGVDGPLHGGEIVGDDEGAGEDGIEAEARVEDEDGSAANEWAEQGIPRGMHTPVEHG